MPYKDRQVQLAAQKLHYQNNKKDYKNRNQLRRERRRIWINDVLSRFKCLSCVENAPECLDFHHIDPENKIDDISTMLTELRSISRVITEIEKCVVFCANCHRKHHRGTIKVDNIEALLVTIPDDLRDPKHYRI